MFVVSSPDFQAKILSRPCETSQTAQRFQNHASETQQTRTTSSSGSLLLDVILLQKETVEPDLETPRTMEQLAQEHRDFLTTLPADFVDIDLPSDALP